MLLRSYKQQTWFLSESQGFQSRVVAEMGWEWESLIWYPWWHVGCTFSHCPTVLGVLFFLIVFFLWRCLLLSSSLLLLSTAEFIDESAKGFLHFCYGVLWCFCFCFLSPAFACGSFLEFLSLCLHYPRVLPWCPAFPSEPLSTRITVTINF